MNKRGINEITLSGIVYDNARKTFSSGKKEYGDTKYLTKFILVCGNSFSNNDIRVPVIAIGKCADRANLIARHNAFVMVKGQIYTEEKISKEDGKIDILPTILISEISLLKTADRVEFKDYKFRNVFMANDPNNYSEMTQVPKVRKQINRIQRRDKKEDVEK